MRTAGRVVVGAWLLVALLAPWVAPYAPTTRFPDHAFAPPTRLRLLADGAPSRPYFHPLLVQDRLQRVFDDDEARRITLCWLCDGRLFGTRPGDPPLLLAGADALGRDLFSRLLAAARNSLALATLSLGLSLVLGAAAGVWAGYRGGLADALVQRVTDAIVVLPELYVLIALRAALPVALSPAAVFALVTAIFAALGWPLAARGVRAIVARERERDYVLAARAVAASPVRIMVRHLLPATYGFLRTQALLLLPAFVLAEATLSFAGLGFPDDAPGWGTLLAEAANIGALGGAVWLLVPALALGTLVLGANLALDAPAPAPELAALNAESARPR